jgi:hypothetical protein
MYCTYGTVTVLLQTYVYSGSISQTFVNISAYFLWFFYTMLNLIVTICNDYKKCVSCQ